MNFSKQQKQIIETEANKVVVVATAASGKTAVLTERVRYLLNRGADAKKIVVITFTNLAAEELYDRLDRPTGLFVGTIHAYANRLLRAAGVNTSGILEEEEFDKLFPLVQKHPECIKPVDYLLLDESQDSTEVEFKFLLDMVKPKSYMLVGDHRQSIYRWRDAFPDYILNLQDQPDVTTYDLSCNYRNAKSILTYAKSLIRSAGEEYDDYSVAATDEEGRVVTVELNLAALCSTIQRMEAETNNYGHWFILTRTNSQINEVTSMLDHLQLPYDTFKKSQLNNAELRDKMNENTIKVLTIHTAKGLEADNVVVIGAKFYNIEETCISYVAATRAKKLLVWTREPAKTFRARGRRVTNWE